MCNNEEVKSMLEIVQKVRNPAGDDPLFATFESINHNYRAFIEAAHKGMAAMHLVASTNIMECEQRLHGLDQMSEESGALRLNQQFWYHINNFYAWQGLGHRRHVVRRLCGFKPRPRLYDSNPNAIFQIIDKINEDPLKFALWADATSFIDSGDILVLDPIRGSFEIIEVKQEGDSFWTFTSESTGNQIRQFQSVLGVPPNRAEAKTQRLRRQLSRMKKIEHVVQNDVGVDPFLDTPVKIFDSSVSDKFFHAEIADLITRAKSKGYALELIDDCLWVGVYSDHNPKLRLAFAAGAVGVFANDSQSSIDEVLEDALLESRLYTQSAGHWLAMPVFSFDLSDDDVLNLILGNFKVRLYFHWESWGKLLEKYGGKFRWMSKGEYGATLENSIFKRPDAVSKGIPYVSFGNIAFVPPSNHMIRVFTDFYRPSTLAEIVAHMAHDLHKFDSQGNQMDD